MRWSSTTLFGIALVAMLASCKKDDEEEEIPVEPIPPKEVSSFSNLAIGNYWVYERRQVDSLDVDQGMPVLLDSLYVIGDTLLDGETFFMIRRGSNGQPGNGVWCYWRDSADCIVDRNGWIQFSAATFDQVLYTESSGGSSGVNIDYSIPSGTVAIAVPAGTYDAYLVLGQVTSFGAFPVIPDWKCPRDYWAEGVGRVKWYDYFAAGDIGSRVELVRYNVD